jgi:hypothetical protein
MDFVPIIPLSIQTTIPVRPCLLDLDIRFAWLAGTFKRWNVNIELSVRWLEALRRSPAIGRVSKLP